MVRFKGVDDRNAAEALTGTELFVDRSALPDDGEEDEFYHADLSALPSGTRPDAVLGKVTAVQNFGGGDILEITHGGRKGVLIPFTQAAVPEVDVADGFVRIDTVAAGLVEDEDGEAPRRRAASTQAASARAEGRRGQPVTFPRQRADALSRDVSGRAWPVAGRPGAGGRHLVARGRADPRLRHRQAPHASTTRRPAAAPAW